MQQLLGPTNGTCIEDQFIVTGQNTNNIAPIICGVNNGQHSEFTKGHSYNYISISTTKWMVMMLKIHCNVQQS